MSGDWNRSLSDNAYALLGLLAVLGERSGYELKKIADQSIRYFYWSPSRSQVYRTLHQLERLGYAIPREVEQESLPDKRLYRITPAGELTLRAWLARRPLPPDEIRSPATLLIFFGDLVPRDVLLTQLQELRERAAEDLERFREIGARISSEPRAMFRYLVLRRGIADARETIAWVDEVLAALAPSEHGPIAARERLADTSECQRVVESEG